MSSYVYVIGMVGQRPVKIGHSGNPWSRLQALQTANPIPLELRAAYVGGRELEEQLHERFADIRMHGEWFDFGNADPLVHVSEFIRSAGPTREVEAFAHGLRYERPVKFVRPPRVAAEDREVQIMDHLRDNSGQSLSQVARSIGASKSVVKRLLDRMLTERKVILHSDGMWTL